MRTPGCASQCEHRVGVDTAPTVPCCVLLAHQQPGLGGRRGPSPVQGWLEWTWSAQQVSLEGLFRKQHATRVVECQPHGYVVLGVWVTDLF